MLLRLAGGFPSSWLGCCTQTATKTVMKPREPRMLTGSVFFFCIWEELTAEPVVTTAFNTFEK